jgi:hypothetical protein
MGCGHFQNKQESQRGDDAKLSINELGKNITEENTLEFVKDWPEESKKVVETMLNKYGPPTGFDKDKLIWGHNQEVLKRSIVVREPIDHNFPKPHADVLQQFVEYKIDPKKADEVLSFNGSIILDRTRGEMSARCDSEEMNVLAMNLAHEIMEGNMSAEEAKKQYAESAATFMQEGQANKYMAQINFSQEDAASPDSEMQAEEAEEQED